MSAIILDGKKVAEQIRETVRIEVEEILRTGGRTPKLVAVRVGDDPASEVYVRNKKSACEKVGIKSDVWAMPPETTQRELIEWIDCLNQDPGVHGILVQLPLPSHLDVHQVQEKIRPDKDVDGFHPQNMGRLLSGTPGVVPCTPAGIIYLLKEYGIPIEGKRAAVIGRSNIVGKPASLLLLRENATVTICHSKTVDLHDVVRESDIVIAATGKPKTVTWKMVRENSAIIDVGITRQLDGTFVGDVDFEEVRQKAGYITPVPGGIGPMTVAMLLRNTIDCAKNIQNIEISLK